SEIVEGGWSAASEVPPCELGQHLVTCKGLGRARRAVVEERKGRLLAASYPAANERVELGALEQVGQALSAHGNAGVFERSRQLGSREVFAAAKRFGDGVVASSQSSGVQFELPVSPRVAGDHARSDERENPANVRGRNELPRPAQCMSAKDGTVRD